MSEISRICDQLHRAFYGEAWHGPAVMELLADVEAPTAAAHPASGAHSIWEIVHHITVWKRVVIQRLSGQDWNPTGEQDWPPVGDPSEAAWQKARAALQDAHQQLERSIERLQDARLSDPVPGHPYNVYVMLHGVVQHDLYHAGQIALLKKGK